MILFGWDGSKAAANLKKHQSSFEEAKSIFFDDFGVQFFDEDRFFTLGLSSVAMLLIVFRCKWEQGAVIRLISARKAIKPRGTARSFNIKVSQQLCALLVCGEPAADTFVKS